MDLRPDFASYYSIRTDAWVLLSVKGAYHCNLGWNVHCIKQRELLVAKEVVYCFGKTAICARLKKPSSMREKEREMEEGRSFL